MIICDQISFGSSNFCCNNSTNIQRLFTDSMKAKIKERSKKYYSSRNLQLIFLPMKSSFWKPLRSLNDCFYTEST